jgi:hypothetical protein
VAVVVQIALRGDVNKVTKRVPAQCEGEVFVEVRPGGEQEGAEDD